MSFMKSSVLICKTHFVEFFLKNDCEFMLHFLAMGIEKVSLLRLNSDEKSTPLPSSIQQDLQNISVAMLNKARK